MAITYPISFPSQFMESLRVLEQNTVSTSISPFTKRRFSQRYDGELWLLSVTMPPLRRELAQPVLAFISSLRGPHGSFIVPHPGHSISLGTAATVPSTPLVNGAGQEGAQTLLIRSAPVDQVGWLLAGDMIQVGPNTRPHWHRVLQDVDTDSSGEAEIDVWPQLRENTLDGDAVSYTDPLCLFELEDSPPPHEIGRPVQYLINLEAREKLA